MAIGISGDSVVVSANGYPSEDLMAIELRVVSNLMQSLLANGQAGQDELRILRNDQAFELGLPSPVPGN
jgi:hypothetical protein